MAATYKDADGTEIPLVQLLVEVALWDELAQWATGSLGMGRQ